MNVAQAPASEGRLRFLEKEGPQAMDIADKSKTLVIIPFAPVEFHGPHLPLSTDLILGAQFSRVEAEEFLARNPSWYVLIYPVVPLGTDLVPHSGSVAVPLRVIHKVAVSLGRHFVRQGFPNIVFQSGHGGLNHDRALERAARTLNRRYRKRNVRAVAPLGPVMMRLWGSGIRGNLNPLLESKLTEQNEKDFLYETHGGWWETSMVLYHCPERMTEAYRNIPDHLPPVKAVVRLMLTLLQRIIPRHYKTLMRDNRALLEVGISWFWWGTKPGYHGFPSRASRDMGRGSTILASRFFADFLENMYIQRTDLEQAQSLYSLFDLLRWYGLGIGLLLLAVIGLVVFL
jgi:creatinine amidohydrolase